MLTRKDLGSSIYVKNMDGYNTRITNSLVVVLTVFAWNERAAPDGVWLAGGSLLEQGWQPCQLTQYRWQNLPQLRRKKNRIQSAAIWGDSTRWLSAEWNHQQQRGGVSASTRSNSGADVLAYSSRRSWSLGTEKLKFVEVTKAVLRKVPQGPWWAPRRGSL